MAGVEHGTEPTAARDDGICPSGTSSPPSVSFAESGMRQLGVAARSSSPAKRSASERDEQDKDSHYGVDSELSPSSGSPRSPKKSFLQHVSPMPSRFKSTGADSEARNSESLDKMEDETDHGSFGEPGSQMSVTSPAAHDLPSYDEQMDTITSLIQDESTMSDGSKGFAISRKWIDRIRSRTTNGLHGVYEKSAREGGVGPVDNSSIVQYNHAYGDLKDELGETFIPLRSECSLERDFDIWPEEAWNLMMQWYGSKHGSIPVVRYAHITNDNDASSENLQYELFPPICTIQKLAREQDELLTDTIQDQNLFAVNLVASRTEGFQHFLARVKVAASIQMATKVRVWKLLETSKTHDGRSGIPTPVSSRSASPVRHKAPVHNPAKLLVDQTWFMSLEEGAQREKLEIQDDTANENYNGHLKLDTIGFPSYLTLVLEEQPNESSGDEFLSDRSKATAASDGADHTATSKRESRPSQDPSKLNVNAGNARRSPTPSGIMTRGRIGNKGKTRGCTGLVNLGNTCYMNSALQCIRSVEELSTYFLEGKSHQEINASNPLGHGGLIANAYEELVRRIFTGSASFSPQDFRRILGRCQPLFSGYGQQDSQEFLSFLVDGLHEDLNRVLKKPYMENPESDDGTVHDPEAIKALGEKFRSIHKARNDSVAMDLFNGFYKNTMVCPVCDKISITFDPYSLLTLQLPIAQPFQHTVAFAPLSGLPVFVEVDMDRNSNVQRLKDYVGAKVGVSGDNLVMAEMYSGKFYKVFEDAEVLAEANIQLADKLILCELDQAPTNWPPWPPCDSKKVKNNRFSLGSFSNQTTIPEMNSPAAERMAVPILHRFPGPRGISFDLCPTFVLVTKEEARDSDSVLRKVLQRVNTMTTRDIFEESEDVPSQESYSRAESDAAVMEEIETSSSDDSKIQARSVESEDGLVDISMADSQATSREKASEKRNVSRILNPSFYIQPEWRELFEMKIYTSQGEIIPCGWSSLNEHTRLPRLESKHVRQHSSSSRRESEASWNGQTQNRSPQSSEDEDELVRPDTADQPPEQSLRKSSPESDSDSTPQIQHVSNTSKIRVKVGSKKHGAPSSFEKGGSTNSFGNEENDFVLRLGDGIVLDWSDYGIDQLFGKAERTFDNMETLSDPKLSAKQAKRAARKKQGISLDECFEETSKSEVLSEDNAWYCGRCKELRRATKKLEIWTVPDILVVHLKRFSTNSRLRDKIDVLVDFPVEDLNLDGKVGLPEGKPLQYDLFAVDNHYGGLGGGHYTAYAQNFFDKKWYEYNDQMVTATAPASVVTRAAYLLFYRRRSENPLGGKYLEDVVRTAWASSESSSLSGEDLRLDDSFSNGSSNISLGGGAEVNHQQGAQHLLSPAGGQHHLESSARNGLSEVPPPIYGSTEYDEGISMDEDLDNVLPGIEDRNKNIVGPQIPTWDWDKLNEGVNAPPGSSNNTSPAGSDRPEAGDVSEDRLMEDFGDELGNDNENHYIGHVSLTAPEHDEDDGEVTEIKVSSDNEEGS